MTRKILDGSENGNPRRKRSWIKLKIAVFAPIPRVSVNTTIALNAGAFISDRNAYFRSPNIISFLYSVRNACTGSTMRRGVRVTNTRAAARAIPAVYQIDVATAPLCLNRAGQCYNER